MEPTAVLLQIEKKKKIDKVWTFEVQAVSQLL